MGLGLESIPECSLRATRIELGSGALGRKWGVGGKPAVQI